VLYGAHPELLWLQVCTVASLLSLSPRVDCGTNSLSGRGCAVVSLPGHQRGPEALVAHRHCLVQHLVCVIYYKEWGCVGAVLSGMSSEKPEALG